MSVKKSCSFMVLLFVVVLTFSSFSTVFSAASPFALGAPDNIVSNESELRNVINKAAKSTVITLNRDLTKQAF